ncbi:MAG: hemolysin family protein, partial [Methanomassiliicoccaceae archaeon]|nr:hemolysin family protein [Methanomassiliicoccaceae archaeon]
ISIFAEITPKTLAKRNAERYALAYAGSLSITMTILSPILWAFMKVTDLLSRNAKNDSAEAPSFTEDELHVMIDEVTEEGALEHSEGELIKSAMQFDDIKVSEMYTPRSNMTVADIGGGIEALKQLFIDSEYSRIPIYERTMDRIIGAVHTKDFFSKYVKGENFTIGDILMPVKFIPESTSIATLLNDMQKAHIHMAIVLDNFGRTLGLVTMEDVLEELVGDIWDESDEAGYPVNQDKDGSFIVPGEAGIIEVMRKIGAEMPTCDLQDQSISAFVSGIIDGVPKRGDAVLLSNIKIIVRSMKSRRVKEVRIYLLKKEDIPEETQES